EVAVARDHLDQPLVLALGRPERLDLVEQLVVVEEQPALRRSLLVGTFAPRQPSRLSALVLFHAPPSSFPRQGILHQSGLAVHRRLLTATSPARRSRPAARPGSETVPGSACSGRGPGGRAPPTSAARDAGSRSATARPSGRFARSSASRSRRGRAGRRRRTRSHGRSGPRRRPCSSPRAAGESGTRASGRAGRGPAGGRPPPGP